MGRKKGKDPLAFWSVSYVSHLKLTKCTLRTNCWT